jgi:hypothetical protein
VSRDFSHPRHLLLSCLLYLWQIQAVIEAPAPHRAIFLTSCVLHGMDYQYLSVNDTSPMVAFNLWYDALHSSSGGAPTVSYKWVEDWAMPRTDNPLACPPFTFV